MLKEGYCISDEPGMHIKSFKTAFKYLRQVFEHDYVLCYLQIFIFNTVQSINNFIYLCTCTFYENRGCRSLIRWSKLPIIFIGF